MIVSRLSPTARFALSAFISNLFRLLEAEDGQISFGEDAFYQKYEQKIKLLTDKFMPPKDEDEHLRAQKRKEMEQYADYRNYLSFSMFESLG